MGDSRSERSARLTRARAVCSLTPSRGRDLGVGPALDDAQPQHLALPVVELRERCGEVQAQRVRCRQLLDTVVLGRGQRAALDAEAPQRAPLDRTTAEEHREAVAADAVEPGASVGRRLAAELAAVPERDRERLGDEVDRGIGVVGPPREEAEQLGGVPRVERREIGRSEPPLCHVGARGAQDVTAIAARPRSSATGTGMRSSGTAATARRSGRPPLGGGISSRP